MSSDRTGPTWVAGGSGLLGSAVVRRLSAAGVPLVVTGSRDLDLRDRSATAAFVQRVAPAAAVVCAARVGGIGANTEDPVRMLSDNAQMGVSVLDALAASAVDRVVYVGSAAMYPAVVDQPILETSLWQGHPELAHEPYATAKLLALSHLRAVRRQLGLRWNMIIPTNIYGPGDNFDPAASHVVPALMRKFWEAKESGDEVVRLWGTGQQRREFVHADDAARAVELVLRDAPPEDELPLNVGTGVDHSIAEVARMTAEVVGYTGRTAWMTDRPEGPQRRVLDSGRLRGLGWSPQTSLQDGLTSLCAWLGTALPSGQVRGWT